MSLETWLLIAAIILLIAFCGISLFWFFALDSRIDLLTRERLRDLRQFENGREFPQVFRRIDYIINEHEERHDLRLTGGARQMLTIPVEEQLYDLGRVDWNQVDESVEKIFEVLERDRSGPYRTSSGALKSVGVIKAFHIRFCNIPPFCAPTE